MCKYAVSYLGMLHQNWIQVFLQTLNKISLKNQKRQIIIFLLTILWVNTEGIRLQKHSIDSNSDFD